MKKFFYTMVIGLAIVGLSACSSTKNNSGAKSKVPTSQSTPAQGADQAGGADKKAN